METLTPEKESAIEVELETEKEEKSEKETNNEKELPKASPAKLSSIFAVLRENNQSEKKLLKEETKSGQTEYLKSLENKTVADIMEEKRKKELRQKQNQIIKEHWIFYED